MNYGHWIISGAKDGGAYILGGTTESNTETFIPSENLNYFPRIEAKSNVTRQILCALTSNITVPSNICFIDKNNERHHFLKFNINNASFIQTLKESWKEITNRFLVFFNGRKEVVMTSAPANCGNKLSVSDLDIYYE